VIEAGAKDTTFSSKTYGWDVGSGPSADARRAFSATMLDFYSSEHQTVPIQGLSNYTVDQRRLDERRS